MDQLLDFIHSDRIPEAGLRASELATALSEIPYRRGFYLDETRKVELLNARTQLQVIHETLADQHDPLMREQKSRLVKICRDVGVSLRKNLGIIKGEIDRGAKQ